MSDARANFVLFLFCFVCFGRPRVQTEPVFAFVWQIVFFHEQPSPWSFLGLLLIVACVSTTATTACVDYFSALMGRYPSSVHVVDQESRVRRARSRSQDGRI